MTKDTIYYMLLIILLWDGISSAQCTTWNGQIIANTHAFYRDLGVADIDLGTSANLQVIFRDSDIKVLQLNGGRDSPFIAGQIVQPGFEGKFILRDINNDNQVDFLLYSESLISLLIHEGGTFTNVFSRSVFSSKPVVGDIDNDGDRDILFANDEGEVFLITNHNSEGFQISANAIYRTSSGTILLEDLIDVDTDGDLDLIIKFTPTFQTGSGSFYEMSWLENVEGFFNPLEHHIGGGLCGPTIIGDLDSDGDKDIFYAPSGECFDEGGNLPAVTTWFNNNGSFVETPTFINNQSNYNFSKMQVGDLDNDGSLEIVAIREINERSAMYVLETRKIIDGALTIVNPASGIHDVTAMDFAIADLDRDFDLDIVVISDNGLVLYQNLACGYFPDTPPEAPLNVNCIPYENGIRITWDAANDNEQNSASLTYSIEVSTGHESDHFIVSPESEISSGNRKIIRGGDQCHNLFWDIKDLPGGYYCVRVQAIDNSYIGGAWSEPACCLYQLCAEAIPIRCGRDTIGNTADSSLFNRISNYSICEASIDFHESELIYEIQNTSSELGSSPIFIGMKELGQEAEAGLDIFVIADCNDFDDNKALVYCVDSVVRTGDNTPAMIQIPDPNPESTYYVIIDSKNTPGDFRLSTSCPYDCSDDMPLVCDVIRRVNNFENGSPQISSYYLPELDQYLDGYSGYEYKVPFIAPETGEYTIQLVQDTALLDLFVFNNCNPFKCIATSQTTDSFQVIDLTLTQDDTIYISVDGPLGVVNDFEIVVECCEADTSSISFMNSSNETLICKTEGGEGFLELFHTGFTHLPYAFFLTDTNGLLVDSLSAGFNAYDIRNGQFRIYGVSYHSQLAYTIGSSITEVKGSICAIPSNNYLSLTIDSTYSINIDTTICFGSRLQICDSLMNTSGSYVIHCTTKFGCDSIFNIDLKVDTPHVEIEGTTTFCSGDSTRLKINGIFDSYLWSTGDTSDLTVVKESGDYSVTVTSENSCTDSATVSVTETENLMVDLGPDTTLCDGIIYQLDPGSFASYLWSTGDTTNTVDVSDSGLYWVQVTDDFGCEGGDSVMIQYIPQPIADAGVDFSICPGDTVALSGSGGTFCLWRTLDGNLISSLCVFTDTPTVTTSYVLETYNTFESTMISSSVTCSDSDTLVIEVFSNEGELALIDDTVICSGESLQLVQTLICESCQCIWSDNNGTIDTDSCNLLVSPAEDQFYTVKVETQNGCILTDSVFLGVVTSPIASGGPDLSICPGDSIALGLSSTGSCLWLDSSKDTIANECIFVARPDSTSNYFLHASSSETFEEFGLKACFSYDTVQITVFSDEIGQLIDDTVICAGESIRLLDTLLCVDCFCSWSTTIGLENPDDCYTLASPTQNTQYILTITTRDDCIAFDTVLVQVAPTPQIDPLGDGQICPGDSVSLTGGDGEGLCLWFNEIGDSLSAGCTISVSPLISQPYILVKSLTSDLDTFGMKTCFNSDTAHVTVFMDGDDILLQEDTIICSGQSVQLVESINCDGCVCEWSSAANVLVPDSCDGLIFPVQSATYTLELVSPNGCEIMDSVEVSVVETPIAQVVGTADKICLGDTIDLLGSGGQSCTWVNEVGELIDTSCRYLEIPEFTKGLQFVASNNGGISCRDTFPITIEVVDPPKVELINDTTICRGIALIPLKESDCPSCSCTWLSFEGLSDPTDCLTEVTPSESTMYILKTEKEGVCLELDTLQIEVLDPVIIETKNDHFNVRQNNVTELRLEQLLDNDPSLGEVPSIRILSDDLPRGIKVMLNGDDIDVTVQDELGLYSFEYIITDENCGSEDTATVELLAVHSDIVAVCNPDEDPDGCQVIADLDTYHDNDITIFDRDGNVVHVARRYNNDWKGINIRNGRRVPTGTYYFVINLIKEPGGPVEVVKGVITIIRR